MKHAKKRSLGVFDFGKIRSGRAGAIEELIPEKRFGVPTANCEKSCQVRVSQDNFGLLRHIAAKHTSS